MRPLLIGTAIVLALAGCGNATGASSGTDPVPPQYRVTGEVVAAPACPVVRDGQKCPPKPVLDANVVISRAGDDVVSVSTGGDGAFEATLPAGTYTVTATQVGGLGSTASRVVKVPQQTSIRISVDSGIR